MKLLLLLLALVAFVGWKGYQHWARPSAGPVISGPQEAMLQPTSVADGRRFECDGRQHCSQMTSRAEAEFFVRHCPDTKMDGDHDGQPCENDSRF